jgi:hypothetical protein
VTAVSEDLLLNPHLEPLRPLLCLGNGKVSKAIAPLLSTTRAPGIPLAFALPLLPCRSDELPRKQNRPC